MLSSLNHNTRDNKEVRSRRGIVKGEMKTEIIGRKRGRVERDRREGGGWKEKMERGWGWRELVRIEGQGVEREYIF